MSKPGAGYGEVIILERRETAIPEPWARRLQKLSQEHPPPMPILVALGVGFSNLLKITQRGNSKFIFEPGAPVCKLVLFSLPQAQGSRVTYWKSHHRDTGWPGHCKTLQAPLGFHTLARSSSYEEWQATGLSSSLAKGILAKCD